MKRNTVKARLKAGKASIGTWLSLCSNIAAEYMAHAGWDWIVVDTEHSPIGFENTISCFQALCTTQTIPLARVAWNEPVLMKRLLDGGAMGLVVPMVNTAEEARQAVAAMKFPPLGFRSIGGGRCMVYGDDYIDTANEEILVIVQSEHIQAVENIEAILSVDGVDGCFIGPNDLAGSMGIRYGKGSQHPEFEAAIQKVLEGGKKTGKAAGIHCRSAEEANRRLEEGFRFVACLNDAGFMRQAAKDARAKINYGN